MTSGPSSPRRRVWVSRSSSDVVAGGLRRSRWRARSSGSGTGWPTGTASRTRSTRVTVRGWGRAGRRRRRGGRRRRALTTRSRTVTPRRTWADASGTLARTASGAALVPRGSVVREQPAGEPRRRDDRHHGSGDARSATRRRRRRSPARYVRRRAGAAPARRPAASSQPGSRRLRRDAGIGGDRPVPGRSAGTSRSRSRTRPRPVAPTSPGSSSTYGRIRSGSKSSAAAASAVRASRSASDARWVQAHDGVPSGARGAAHSGQTCPFGSFTRGSLPVLPLRNSRDYPYVPHNLPGAPGIPASAGGLNRP